MATATTALVAAHTADEPPIASNLSVVAATDGDGVHAEQWWCFWCRSSPSPSPLPPSPAPPPPSPPPAPSQLAWSMGLAPRREGPLVNEPGHPLSSVRAEVSVSLPSTATPVSVTCAFRATATDYTSQPWVRDNVTTLPDLAASIVATQPAQTVTLQPGAQHAFSFLLERNTYRRLASTYLDAAAGFPAVPVREPPRSMRIALAPCASPSPQSPSPQPPSSQPPSLVTPLPQPHSRQPPSPQPPSLVTPLRPCSPLGSLHVAELCGCAR
jgi:hypothetical protein